MITFLFILSTAVTAFLWYRIGRARGREDAIEMLGFMSAAEALKATLHSSNPPPPKGSF